MELLERGDLDLCLTIGRVLMATGDTCQAERVFKSVLSQAEKLEGEGPLTGMVLLDLHALYEKQGRIDEATPAWERIRRILVRGVQLCYDIES